MVYFGLQLTDLGCQDNNGFVKDRKEVELEKMPQVIRSWRIKLSIKEYLNRGYLVVLQMGQTGLVKVGKVQ